MAAIDFPATPVDNQQFVAPTGVVYVWSAARTVWQAVAVLDMSLYAQLNSPSSVTIAASAPAAPTPGLLWWNSELGEMFTWYDDGNSAQWVSASAQNPLQYPFDGRSDLVLSFSLRRLRTLYTGPLVRVRRSSDNVEQDFGVGQTIVAWADILAFIGGGSGFVSRWYDQSGLPTRDLVQATTTKQPQIIQLGSALPAVLFDGVDDTLNTGRIGTSYPQPLTEHICYRRITASSNASMTDPTGTELSMVLNIRTVPTLSDNIVFAGSGSIFTDNNISMPVGTRGVVAVQWSGTTSRVEINSAAVNSFAPGTNIGVGSMNAPSDGIALGSAGDGILPSNAEVQELLFFNAAHGQAQMQADNAEIRAAWGF